MFKGTPSELKSEIFLSLESFLNSHQNVSQEGTTIRDAISQALDDVVDIAIAVKTGNPPPGNPKFRYATTIKSLADKLLRIKRVVEIEITSRNMRSQTRTRHEKRS